LGIVLGHDLYLYGGRVTPYSYQSDSDRYRVRVKVRVRIRLRFKLIGTIFTGKE
jgi:hypothetical protein